MYRITLIGKSQLQTIMAEQEQAEKFFSTMGLTLHEAIRGTIPEYVVTKVKPNELKELQPVEIAMHKVKSIEIERGEGPNNLLVKKTFKTFKEANQFLSNQSGTYPKQGYDKHYIKVTWEDDTEYNLRLDCRHYSVARGSDNCIDETIKQSINYYLKLEKPNSYYNDSIKFYNHLKQTCLIGD